MTNAEKMLAYEAIKDRFDLKWRQRDALDAAPEYEAILQAAHWCQWVNVERMLRHAQIIK